MKVQRRLNSGRVGVIEVGSRYVRYMVGTFTSHGFQPERRLPPPFRHDIDVDNIHDAQLAQLWNRVLSWAEDLERRHCDKTLVFGTELCRRLQARNDRLPAFVAVLAPETEAGASWAAGFLTQYNPRATGGCTTIDQGGGSTEIASGTWTGMGIADFESRTLDDFGSKRLAKIFDEKGEESAKTIAALLQNRDGGFPIHKASGANPALVLLGGVATKLGFNIKHKRHDEDDYNPQRTERTVLTVQDIQKYYNDMARLYRENPQRARYVMDRRTVDADEFERVMSGSVLLMLLMIKLNYPAATISTNGIRHGLAFQLAVESLKPESNLRRPLRGRPTADK